jgi:Tol biopolymer transport system component
VYLWADEDRPGLHRVNIDGGAAAIVAEMPGYTMFRPQWSPDGQMIAFSVWGESGSDVDVPGGSDVYVVDRDGANLRSMSGDARDGLVGWTPDGTRILYWAGEPGGASGAFYMVDVSDGTSSLLSGPELNTMCSYNNCSHISIRPG